MKISLLGQIIFMSFLVNASTVAQAPELKAALPMVASASVPLYPPLAHTANIEGVVHVRITTDGQRVKIAHAEDGPKLLAAAAEENAITTRTIQSSCFVCPLKFKSRPFIFIRATRLLNYRQTAFSATDSHMTISRLHRTWPC